MRGAICGKCWKEKWLVDKSEISEAWLGTKLLGGEVYCDNLCFRAPTLPRLLLGVGTRMPRRIKDCKPFKNALR